MGTWTRRSVGMLVPVCALWVGLLGSAAAAQAPKIGIVDLQQVLLQSQRGTAIKQKLDQERNGRRKDLEARQQEVVKMQADLEKQASVLSEQAKREKREAIERKGRELQRLAEDADRELGKKVRDAELDITREILQVVQEYGKDQGFTFIMERSNAVYANESVDVTAEVIKRFDAKAK
ncbi:MAG TPA: OmpH family outer membrane protein [Candidatus Sulfotelmatobacter sp.]|nr:OmpH family outer membrane protein [Candidatus Sulfotelmatobacter sp.]